MYFRVGDTHRGLRRHTGLFCPFDRRNDITRVIQTAEDTGDICSLRVLHFVHQFAHVSRHRIHTQRIQSAVQHMGLDTCLIKRLTERTHCLIWVLAVQQVYLFARTAVGLYAVKTTHVNDHRRNTR